MEGKKGATALLGGKKGRDGADWRESASNWSHFILCRGQGGDRASGRRAMEPPLPHASSSVAGVEQPFRAPVQSLAAEAGGSIDDAQQLLKEAQPPRTRVQSLASEAGRSMDDAQQLLEELPTRFVLYITNFCVGSTTVNEQNG